MVSLIFVNIYNKYKTFKKETSFWGTAVAIILPIIIFYINSYSIPKAPFKFILPISLLIVPILFLIILAIEELIYYLVYKIRRKRI